jgi:hypothetical protein
MPDRPKTVRPVSAPGPPALDASHRSVIHLAFAIAAASRFCAWPAVAEHLTVTPAPSQQKARLDTQIGLFSVTRRSRPLHMRSRYVLSFYRGFRLLSILFRHAAVA